MLLPALVVAGAGGVGMMLQAGGASPRTSAVAFLVAGLALLGLVVAVNGLLRVAGLGGEGLAGAAGVLGATLILLPRSFPVLGAGEPAALAEEGLALFGSLELAGWALTGGWVAAAGRALRRLITPSGFLGWGSVGAAVAIAAVLLESLFRAGLAGAAERSGSLCFGLIVLWSGGLVATCAFGRPVAAEPREE